MENIKEGMILRATWWGKKDPRSWARVIRVDDEWVFIMHHRNSTDTTGITTSKTTIKNAELNIRDRSWIVTPLKKAVKQGCPTDILDPLDIVKERLRDRRNNK